VGLRTWLQRVGLTRPSAGPLAPRRDRRAAARDRHAAGGAGWSKGDRHEGETGLREVADVSPGTPGSGGSRLTRG
jgi:hypothetical protein